jgi:hypothetical protein
MIHSDIIKAVTESPEATDYVDVGRKRLYALSKEIGTKRVKRTSPDILKLRKNGSLRILRQIVLADNNTAPAPTRPCAAVIIELKGGGD